MKSGTTDTSEEARRQEAGRRDALLRRLLHASGWQVTREIATIAREELGIPRSTLFRLVARFRKSKRSSSLLPKPVGTPHGAKRLDIRVESIISEMIDRFWLRRERPSMSALMQRLIDACQVEGLRPPNRRTVKCRVDELERGLVVRRRGEGDVASTVSSPGSYSASSANEVWQIDHTLVDVIIVDEQLRKPIGRPVLTIAIDVCTRMVAGFYLSLDPPSSVSVGLCLLHAAYDKTSWMAERGLDLTWPISGLPSILHCDNGAEFHSKALQNACREYGMKLQFRPPATPRFGGHIERLIGTVMGAVHILPGTTFSNIKARGDYDAEGRATFTLRELEAWLTLQIAGVYHHRIHSSLLRPPVNVWQDLQGKVDFDLPPDRMAFWTSFLPSIERRLSKDGIHFEKIRYWSDALSRDIGRGSRLTVRYDPRDLSRIFVRQSGGHFVEARYRNLAYPPVTWWEWRHTKRHLYEQGKRELSEATIFSSLAHQRRIEDAASLASTSARRKIARRPSKDENPSDSMPIKITGIDTAKVSGEGDDDMEFWE
ncbi:Mu transposase C-terminal domain-containing protein [Methylovirgula sp. 4M-Z18]|uniref:Mu transposase C-terminal domain-containing protein n=1 Tax=Methylovirgula sp. 4M-Z18 TaxID=2293567 RepID=UPI000E2F542C|nr:Mu transposase C-terminal domain-containing protein [Methylovirgula sp. 4M-Z18]RFB76696.1 transposase [Methylovirgula sp. 4M-Z18]